MVDEPQLEAGHIHLDIARQLRAVVHGRARLSRTWAIWSATGAFKAASVARPTTPSAASPWRFWNRAHRVDEPLVVALRTAS